MWQERSSPSGKRSANQPQGAEVTLGPLWKRSGGGKVVGGTGLKPITLRALAYQILESFKRANLLFSLLISGKWRQVEKFHTGLNRLIDRFLCLPEHLGRG